MLQAFGIVLVIIAGTVLGGTGVALRTAAGRTVVVGAALGYANKAIDGTITVGRVTGSVRTGLEVHDVSIVGRDSVPLATIPLLSVRYRLRDLLSLHIVLGQVSLSHPRINLVQYPGGRFNYHRIFRMGGPSSSRRKPLVAFHDVDVDSGTITIRTVANAGDTARYDLKVEVMQGHRIRRIENLSTHLSYLRLSSPVPGEGPIMAEVDALKARISDPALVIRGVKGSVEQAGDSVEVDLPWVAFGSSQARVRGTVSWPTDTILLNLVADTRDAVLYDLHPLVPIIPKGLEATGVFTVRSIAGNITSIGSNRMTIHARREGGTVTGRAEIVLGPRQSWSVTKTDLTLDNLDLEYVRPFLDTLPLAGRLTGTVQVDGPHDHLDLDANVTFRDSLVAGWPVSTIEGGGVLSLAPQIGAVFQGFEVRRSKIDLGTVRRLIPATALRGFIVANGTLNGPWLEASLDGTLRHADPPYPETVAQGAIQVDARGEILGVWAKLAFDSLSLPGFWTSYPDFKILGTFAGDLTAEGYLDALHLVADLKGPAGQLKGSTTVVLRSPHYAASNLDFAFRQLDIRSLYTEPAGTSLNGQIRGRIDTDSLRAPTGGFVVSLDSSRVGGTLIDSGRAMVSTADSLLRVDSLIAWAPNARVTARGALGIRSPRRETLVLTATLDSLSTLEPVLASLLELPEDTARRPLGGTMVVNMTVTGALDAYELTTDVTAPKLRWGQFAAAKAGLRGVWASEANGPARMSATVDSLRYGSLGFALVQGEATGVKDSITWIVQGQNGPDATVKVAGAVIRDSVVTRILLDSARLALPAARWTLAKPTTIVFGDSSVDVGTLSLLGADGKAKVELVGSVPLKGHGRLSVALEALSLKDLFAMLQKETQDIQGTLKGTIDLAGTAKEPQIHSSLTVTDASYADFHMPQIAGEVDYAAHRLQGAFHLRNATAVVMDITADLPIDLAFRGAAGNRQLPGPIAIRAVADSVDLAILEAVFSAVRNASGQLDGDFGVIGTWEKPQLNGAVAIRNGAVTYPGIGARHEKIDGRLVMHGDTLQVDQLTMMSGGGTLNVKGNIRLEELTHPVMDLHLTARDFFSLNVRDFATATATGEFDLLGPLIGSTFRGYGTVTKGTLHYADLVNKRILNLEDTLFREVVDTTLIRRQGLGRAFQNRFIDSLVVDSLRLEMGSEVWLRSTEANIQLAGNITLNKFADEYRAEGVLTTSLGTYELPLGVSAFTREFQVTRGAIRMLGTPDLDALVDIDAQHVIRRRVGDNVNVFVHIGGTLYVPIITLSSDVRPPLPQEEIVAYLLFGRPLNPNDVRSQSQQAVLQSAMSALAGQVENSLLANLGLPYLPNYWQISPGESVTSGTQIQFGWQWTALGIPVFLTPSYRFGCQQGNNLAQNSGFSMEFRVSKEWRVAGSVEPVRGCNTTTLTPGSTTRQAGVDVLWEKNY